MLVFKDVLHLVQNVVLQGGRVPTRKVPYRQNRHMSVKIYPKNGEHSTVQINMFKNNDDSNKGLYVAKT